jgi:hypothetical protein
LQFSELLINFTNKLKNEKIEINLNNVCQSFDEDWAVVGSRTSFNPFSSNLLSHLMKEKTFDGVNIKLLKRRKHSTSFDEL